MNEIKQYDLADLHTAFDAGEIAEGKRIEVKGYVATIGETITSKKTGNPYRVVGIKGSPDAAGVMTVALNRWNVNLIKEEDKGQELTFQGYVNISNQGFISLGGASIPSRRPQCSQGDSKSPYRPRNPLPPIVGMMFNDGMASFKPIDFLNGDREINIKEIGARFDCVIRAITIERIQKLANLAKEE